MRLAELAPAKVNLFLHVGAARGDGRHPLCSLVVFADVGDRLVAESTVRPELCVDGPFMDQAGPLADNLVSRALALANAPPMRVALTKMLPGAAGLGGGTSDAGAALRLAKRLFDTMSTQGIETAARALGADGLMCLRAEACVAQGIGELLSSAPGMPALPAVLVNPRVPSPTAEVYRAYDDGEGWFTADRPEMPQAFASIDDLAVFLSKQRNDLEAPAIRLAPVIAEVRNAIGSQAGVRLARMSGSGATCFGIFESDVAAIAAAESLAVQYPHWWVQSCRLNGPG